MPSDDYQGPLRNFMRLRGDDGYAFIIPGAKFADAVQEAIVLAGALDKTICFKFSGVAVRVRSDSAPAEVKAQFDEDFAASLQPGWQSDPNLPPW